MKTWRQHGQCLHDEPEVGDRLLEKLKQELRIKQGDFIAYELAQTKDYFRTLIATIISQNTNEKNTYRAFGELERRIGVECAKLSQTDVQKIAEAIKPAGLYAQKSQAIKSLALFLMENYGCQIELLLKQGPEKVKEELGKIRGIGSKTIDVLLANYGYPVLPIDTHVKRTSIRIGLASPGSYEKMQAHLHKVFSPERRLEAHLYLIKLGRTFCLPRNPKCSVCPVSALCCYNKNKPKK
jgi:endonuclease-3